MHLISCSQVKAVQITERLQDVVIRITTSHIDQRYSGMQWHAVMQDCCIGFVLNAVDGHYNYVPNLTLQ